MVLFRIKVMQVRCKKSRKEEECYGARQTT